MFVVMFPRTALKMSANGISSITAVPIRADHGVGALVSPFLSGLRQGLTAGSPIANPRFDEAAIDLVCAAVTDHASRVGAETCGMSLSGPIFASCTADRNRSVGAVDPLIGLFGGWHCADAG